MATQQPKRKKKPVPDSFVMIPPENGYLIKHEVANVLFTRVKHILAKRVMTWAEKHECKALLDVLYNCNMGVLIAIDTSHEELRRFHFIIKERMRVHKANKQ